MATTAFSSLNLPAPDDTMEMSSPANRNLDDDIDIDFDDYQGGVQVTDDERMLEDADATRPTTATDDMMEDDLLPGEQSIVEEEIMQDDEPEAQGAQQVEDEELIDYGEDDFQDQVVEDAANLDLAQESTFIVDTGDEQADEEVVRVPDDSAEVTFGEATAESEQILEPSTDLEEPTTLISSEEDGVALQDPSNVVDQPHGLDLHPEVVAETESHTFAAEHSLPPPISISAGTSVHTDTPGTPTDTGLHAMNVRYGDFHMPLFKSRRQPDGLLKDDNLANLSLAELIRSCRQRLAIKTGEDVSEEQELVLCFDHLGLMLVEDSRSAFESSLNDVLDVFLQLHRNDGTLDIPPLSLTLTLQLKFASSFSILKQAAAVGQGMSQFRFLNLAPFNEFHHEDLEQGSHAGQDQNNEEQGEEAYQEEFGDDYEETNHVDHTDGRGQITSEHDDGTRLPADATTEDDHKEHNPDQGDYHEDTTNEAYEDYHADDNFEEAYQSAEYTADAIYNAPESLADAEQGKVAGATDTYLETHTDAGDHARSSPSSTTIQGDSLNNSAAQAEEHDDFSTFLTEYEADDHEADFPKESERAILDGAQDVAAHENQALPANETYDQQQLGSEDFLNELKEHDYGDEAHYSAQDHEQYGALEYEEDHNYDQADTYGEQQDDYQPGEENTQYHTAQDFLNDEAFEQRQDDQANEDEEENDDTVIHHQVDRNTEEDDQEDFEEQLDFGDETEEYQDDQTTQPAVSGSLLRKRSFDELDDLEDEEPELKKPRAS